jgi:hypothetical protein
LTALDMGEPEPSPVRRSLLRSSSGSKGRNIGFQTGALAADLVELLGHGNPHWAGNLNVFVGTHAVERHLARALRIYSGRTNLACFMVGSGRDAYSFRLAGRGAEWDAQLVDPMRSNTPIRRMFDADPTDRVVEDHWIEVTSRHIMFLVIRAPASCDQGEVEVHVTQRSTGRTAVVEFSMDTHAAGPGCFVVS